jgi:hypothetical protein
MIIDVLTFLGAILFLVLTYAIVAELRRSFIKRRIPYELMLVEKAAVFGVIALVSKLLPVGHFDTFSTAVLIVSLIILSIAPGLLLLKYLHRRSYVITKRRFRKFF